MEGPERVDVLLRQAEIVPLDDKYGMEERLHMDDDLIEQDPRM